MNTLINVLTVSESRDSLEEDLLETMGSMVDAGTTVANYKASIDEFQNLRSEAPDLKIYDAVSAPLTIARPVAPRVQGCNQDLYAVIVARGHSGGYLLTGTDVTLF